MKKVVIAILILLVGTAFAVDRAGRADSFTRADVLSSVYERGWGFTSLPWKYVDSTSVNNAINEMALTISDEFQDAAERWDTIATTANTHRYSLNTDCIDPKIVFAKGKNTSGDGNAIQRILLSDWGYNTSSDDPLPKYWSSFGSGTRTLLVDPVPNTSDTLLVLYRARANSMSADTTTSNVNIKYYELLVLRTVIYLMENNTGAKVQSIYDYAKGREALLLNMYAQEQPATIKPDIK